LQTIEKSVLFQFNPSHPLLCRNPPSRWSWIWSNEWLKFINQLHELIFAHSEVFFLQSSSKQRFCSCMRHIMPSRTIWLSKTFAIVFANVIAEAATEYLIAVLHWKPLLFWFMRHPCVNICVVHVKFSLV